MRRPLYLRKVIWVTLLSIMLLPSLGFSKNNIVENAAANDEHVVWVKTPIKFVVPKDKQRMLSFPARVEIDNQNPKLTTDKVTIYNNNGTLYVTAHKTFEPILLPIKVVSTGEVILVYLSSSKSAQDNHPLDVVVPSISKPAYSSGATKEKPTVTINDLSLLRFATEQFSLQRLARHPENIVRTPMYTHRTVDIYYGDEVMGFPLISWRAGDLYVTAVQLKNTTNHTVYLSPGNLIGHWQAASFYRRDQMKTLTTPLVPYNKLTSSGTKRDFTLLFVVSTKPFGESLNALNPFVRSGV